MNNIEDLISIADAISLELGKIKDTIEPYEYESWFEDNLDAAYDLLCEVKDLIGVKKVCIKRSVDMVLKSHKGHLSEIPLVIDKCKCSPVAGNLVVIYFGEQNIDKVEKKISEWFELFSGDWVKKTDVCDDIEVKLGNLYMKAYDAIPVNYEHNMRVLQVKADWISTCDVFL